MAVTLANAVINQGANVGKSYFENLAGGTTAALTVYNTSAFPFSLVLFRVNEPIVSYTIPANSSLILEVKGLLVAGILSTALGAVTGSLVLTVTDF